MATSEENVNKMIEVLGSKSHYVTNGMSINEIELETGWDTDTISDVARRMIQSGTAVLCGVANKRIKLTTKRAVKMDTSYEAKLDRMILSTPTGSYRNKLSTIKLILDGIENDLVTPERLETIVQKYVNDTEAEINQ